MEEVNYSELEIKDFENEYIFLDSIFNLKNIVSNMCISIYAKSDLIFYLMMELLYDKCFSPAYIDFDGENEDYCDEYCLSIDPCNKVWVEPAFFKDGRFKHSYSDITFIYQEDCRQVIIDNSLKDKSKTVLFGLKSDNKSNKCNGDCIDCIHYNT